MTNLIALMSPDVAHLLAHGDHEFEGLTLVAAPEEIAIRFASDRLRSLLLLSPDVIRRAEGADDASFDWCARIAELDMPVILACAPTGSDHDVIRALSARIRVDVWHYQEERSGESLDTLIESASVASLSMAAWHSIHLRASSDLDARVTSIGRALFRHPSSFARTRDVSGFGLSALSANMSETPTTPQFSV